MPKTDSSNEAGGVRAYHAGPGDPEAGTGVPEVAGERPRWAADRPAEPGSVRDSPGPPERSAPDAASAALRRRCRRDVAAAARALATLAGGGLHPGRALALVAARTANPRLAACLRAVQAEVTLGASVAAALGRHPTMFSPLHVAVVRAGEFAGGRGRALADAAELLELQVARRDRIRATVAQPLTAFALVALVIAIAVGALTPAFAHVYSGLDTLPLPTRALLALVCALGRGAVPLVAGALPAVLLVRRWLRTPEGRARAHAARLRVPLVGPLERAAALAHGARAAAALLRANMPADQALGLVADDSDNAEIAAALRDARVTAAAGGSPAVALHARGLLGADAACILTAGERSGDLDGAYADLAHHLDGEVDAVLHALAGRLGPALVATVAVLVAGTLVTLYLPVARLLS